MWMIYIFFWLVKALIAVVAIIMLVMWPKAPGRVWLMAGFSCLLASGVMYILNQALFQITIRNSNSFGTSFHTSIYSLSQIVSILAEFIDMASPALILVGTIVLGNHFRNSGTGAQIPGKDGSAQWTPNTPESISLQRGKMLMALAIISTFIWPLGIAVRIMAGGDLKKIRAGQMDSRGKNLAEVSYLVGMITSLIMVGACIALLILILALATNPN